MYDGGIEEAFKDTVYEAWTRVFKQMSANNVKVNYNKLMITENDENLINLVEMLFKGRLQDCYKRHLKALHIGQRHIWDR